MSVFKSNILHPCVVLHFLGNGDAKVGPIHRLHRQGVNVCELMCREVQGTVPSTTVCFRRGIFFFSF